LCRAALSLAFVLLCFAAEAGAQVVERGRFRVYDTGQVQGVENYEIRREGGGLSVSSRLSLPFWGEERRPSLKATLRAGPDLTPLSFSVRGIDQLEADVDTSVRIDGGEARVREGVGTRRVRVAGRFFTLNSYAPVTLEMLLLRYWLGHGGEGTVTLLPGGDEATVERRGTDTLNVGGRRVSLERFHLESTSLGWGRQTLWLDSAGRLAAAVNLGGDVESNWTALGDGYDRRALRFLKIRDHVSPAVLSAVAAEAHRFGMTLVGHAPRALNPVDAVLAGQGWCRRA
jgi:hypothetical protein